MFLKKGFKILLSAWNVITFQIISITKIHSPVCKTDGLSLQNFQTGKIKHDMPLSMLSSCEEPHLFEILWDVKFNESTGCNEHISQARLQSTRAMHSRCLYICFHASRR